MIRRGGVNPPLTQPYEGPFRVDSRTQTGVKVHLPGRGIEEIALARVKPAYAEDEDPDQDFDNLEGEVPPSPPRPGRRPGPRTRQPEPTQRTTRQHRTNVTASSNPPEEGEAARVENNPQPAEYDSEDDHLSNLRRNRPPVTFSNEETSQPGTPPATTTTPAEPNPRAQEQPPEEIPAAEPPGPGPSDPPTSLHRSVPRFTTNEHQRTFSKRGGPVPRHILNNNQTRSRTHSFSNPRPGNFSFRRHRPDVTALTNAIRDHLNL